MCCGAEFVFGWFTVWALCFGFFYALSVKFGLLVLFGWFMQPGWFDCFEVGLWWGCVVLALVVLFVV